MNKLADLFIDFYTRCKNSLQALIFQLLFTDVNVFLMLLNK